MADKDYTINIQEQGADEVVRAFNQVAASEDKMAQGADKATAAGEKTQGMFGKLASAAIKGAGAFSGVGAATVGFATSMKELSPEMQKGVSSAQAFAGVLAGFGPLGQLASGAVSLVTAAVVALSGEEEDIIKNQETLSDQWRRLGNDADFLAKSFGQIVAQFEDASDAAIKLRESQDRMFKDRAKFLLATESQQKTALALDKEIIAATQAAEKAISARAEAEYKLTEALANKDREAAINRQALAIKEEYRKIGITYGVVIQDAETLARTQLNAAKAETTLAQERLQNALSSKEAFDKLLEPANEAEVAIKAVNKATSEGFPAFEQFSRMAQMAAANVRGAFQAASILADAQIAKDKELTDSLIAEGMRRAKAQIAIDEERAASEAKAAEESRAAYDLYANAATGALEQATLAAVMSGESFTKVLSEQLKVMAIQAGFEALRSTASGFYNLAVGNIPGATAAFTSAALYGALAAGAGVGAAAFGAASGGGGGASGGASGSGGSSSDFGPSGGTGSSGPVQNTYIINNAGVIGLDRDLDRRFAEGTRREQRRPGGIRQGR